MYFGLTGADVALERGPPIRLSPGLAVARFRFAGDAPPGIRAGIERVAVHEQGDDSFEVRFTGWTDGAYVVDRDVLGEIVASLEAEDDYGEWRADWDSARPDWIPPSMAEQ
ncbi:hypothetical protein [Halobellus rubicundus]|uniref:Uncharacterized protein n=1 Tax=Halobellus rubicundus TaxID=2996466 RepID=A0ABD5M9F9_9EURY